ncbi:MAG: PIN domain-containing protein [Clostridia bacterium]|nr:PIN domain-containing protein [Clostridia bacterium]
MKKCLIDAGPLIALFDKSDGYHEHALSFIQGFKGILITTWPVVTEVCYMLNFSTRAQTDFLKWIGLGAVKLHEISNLSIERIIELINKYDDVPMDMADASLVVAAEETGVKEVISIDSDFNIYRTINRKYLKNILKKENGI